MNCTVKQDASWVHGAILRLIGLFGFFWVKGGILSAYWSEHTGDFSEEKV